MTKITFEAKIEHTNNKYNATYVSIPFDVKATFGKSRVKVKATFDGVPYQGSIAKMSGIHVLGLRSDVRAQVGKTVGEFVTVILQEDTEPRIIVIPNDFQKLLDKDKSVLSFFNKLSYTHRKEYIQWITSAKRETTKQRRMKKAIEMLEDKVKHP